MVATLRGAPVAYINAVSGTIAYPAGILAGDIGILVMAYNPTSGVTAVDPTGWTFVDEFIYGSAHRSRYYTRTMDGTETGNLTVAVSAAQKHGWAMQVWGPAAGVVLGGHTWANDALAPAGANTGTTVDIAPVATTAGQDSFYATFWTLKGSSTLPTAVTPPAGTTLAGSVFGTGGGATCIASAYDTTSDTDGSVGAGTWTRNAAGSASMSVLTVAFVRPAAMSTNSTAPIGITSTEAFGSPVTTQPLPPLLFTFPMTYPHFSAHRGGNPGPEMVANMYRTGYDLMPQSSAEGDLQLNASGDVVLIHDTTIDRTASASSPITTGAVSSLTSAQWATILMKANAGFTAPDSPAMFLSDFVALHGPNSGRYRCLLLEIKSGNVGPITQKIKDLGLAPQTIASSFVYSEAKAARAAGLASQWLSFATPTNAELNQCYADGVMHVGCDQSLVTSAMSTYAHSLGIRVWAYTVNSTAARDTFLAAGGDGIISNNPWTIDDGFAQSSFASGITSAESVGVPSTSVVSAPKKQDAFFAFM